MLASGEKAQPEARDTGRGFDFRRSADTAARWASSASRGLRLQRLELHRGANSLMRVIR